MTQAKNAAYRDTYGLYYGQMPDDIRRCRQNGHKMLLGYTSDLDVVIEWNDETFADILSTYLKEEPTLASGDVIDSIQSFARIVCYYMIHGLGGEIDIADGSICEYLESRFKTAYVLGGTCAQGAAALNAVGFPVLIHITDRSKAVCSLLDRPGVEMVVAGRPSPIMEGASAEPPVRHMILQYSKDTRIAVNGEIYTIPVSNRLIMDFDKIHKYLPIDRDFLRYGESASGELRAYGISGFNAIVDTAIMEERTTELAAHFRRLKDRNPDCRIYLEDAHYLNFDLKRIVFAKFAGLVDIFSMNEEELVDHSDRLGFATDKDDLTSVLEGLAVLAREYSMRGIVLHTKDYSLYCGEEQRGVDIEKGLTLGNLLAGTRARVGRYGSYADCGETLRLPLSPVGTAFHEQLARIGDIGKSVFLVPSRYMEKPKYTIGLGDSFMGGFLISLEG
jgi:ADP-dependent phosphofructokinase/glucokinase